ncbi:MAG TPA: MFS transporter [Candidatus Saccharimonadales bacterium]|nr:MFS transporter [Candidatus Saccharimonadales bacterium]
MIASPRRPYYGWVIVLVLGVTETVSWGVVYYAFSVFVTPTSAELGWSRAEIAGAFSVALVVSGLTGLFVGRWLDDHGPRLLMTVGSVAAVGLVLAWSQARDLVSFYAVWGLLGVVMATILYGPALATVTVWFRRRRARALTVLTLMAGLASTIFIPLAAWLVAAQGRREALVTLAVILGVVTIIPHAVFLRRRPADLGLAVDGDRIDVPSPHPPELSASLREALRQPTFKWIAVAFALYALGVGVPVHLVAYLGDQGYSLGFAAAATGAIGAAQVFGRLFFAPLEGRLPPRTLSLLIYAGQPVALLVLLLVPGVAGVALFVVLFGAARGMETLVRSTLTAGLYGPARFASIYAAVTLFTTLTQAVSPVGLGIVYDAIGSYVPGLWTLFSLSCIAAVAVHRGDRRPAA